MIFTPIEKAKPYETIGYFELWQCRANAHLKSDEPDAFEVGSPEYIAWGKILDGEREALRTGLQQGSLSAYVLVESENRFYRVPAAHWSRSHEGLEGEPGETLFCWNLSEVPRKFHDLPLFFFKDEVSEWEKRHFNSHEPNLIGSLPTYATQKHRSCEATAIRVAEIVRARKCKRAPAIRDALTELGNPRLASRDSNERAVRETFDMMFDAGGWPHPK